MPDKQQTEYNTHLHSLPSSHRYPPNTSVAESGASRSCCRQQHPLAAVLLAAFAALLALPLQAEAQTAGICGRTAEVQTAIVAKISGVTDCADVTATQLAAITGTLDLRAKNITALAAGDFDGLILLTKLDLSANDLTELPDDVFDDLTALTFLDLHENALTELPDDVFDDLTALTFLDLHENALTELPDDVFDGLTALTQLWLYWNELSTLPAGVFDNNTALTDLILSWNELSTLRAGVFDNNTALRQLNLHENSLSTLRAGVFDNNTALTDLILGGNSLTTLDDDVFDELTALTTLTLWDNSLTTLPAGVFDELTALSELTLTSNHLTTLRAGVFENLTELTKLTLGWNDLTTLPAGVFDGLTALRRLDLHSNFLTELPAGVFDELTALTTLRLWGNELSTLPDDVFDELTKLRSLRLGYNSLSTLRAGVFENLTELTTLSLQGNPGAPFSPTAVALPDDGTVPVAGGTVTLDGSSSGGPWGTNVAYSWALTSPTSRVTVTFDNNTSATPVATIPALRDGAALTFTLTVTGRGTNNEVWFSIDALNGTVPDTDAATVRATVPVPASNAAPSFDSAATFSAAENQTEAGTVKASDSDASDAIVTGYIRPGADAAQFTIVGSSEGGVLTFVSAPNYEAPADADANNDYVVVVRASSGTGAREMTADQTITVTVTDVGGEAPGAPATPVVSPASVSSVDVSWAVPSNAGPRITDYDYQYRVKSTAGSWTEVTNTTIEVTNTTIIGLAEDTEYDVQVRATNAEGTGGWSEPPGSGSTDANAAPSFDSAETFTVVENLTLVGTVEASDSDDSVTGYAIRPGADAAQFSIVAATRELTFVSAPNFEAAADADTNNKYEVVVRASSGTGAREKTVDQTITVTVTDVAGEAPGAPATPVVLSASVSSVDVSWDAPSNAGPPITDYDYQYRVKSTAGSWTEVTNTTIEVTNTTIIGLAEDTEYEVQVRATNAEGTGDWSEPPGSGSTDANAVPVFSSAATFNAAENQTAVGTVQASDSDAGDSVTDYAIQPGADAAQFSIVASTGVLTFVSAPNFEAAADADTDNHYVVVVRATSGTGAREKTADQTITVTVTNVGGEAPDAPATPSVSSASASSLNVSWTAPSNAGPPITDYDYRYRVKSPQGQWTGNFGTTITELSTTIIGLEENTEYEVQVRAENDEGQGGWSEPPGSGTTDANAAPVFTSAATFDAAENQTAVGTVQASDSDDSVTGYAIRPGADGAQFSIVAATGVLTFTSAPNFEAPADADANNDYVVVVRATSGTGAREKTADRTITVTVTDVDGEAPGAPATPSVSSVSASSVTVSWTAPSNAGPPITDYDYQYRVKSPPGSWTTPNDPPFNVSNLLTELSKTITGLAANTEYEVQVRATNAEGTGDWSAPPGSGSTDANAAPSFTSPAAFDAAENQTAVGTVQASDSDAGDSVTGYVIQPGADAAQFTIVASTGVLTFKSEPNFEAAADANTDNDYVVVVRASSGTGTRVKTADQTITVTVTDVVGEAPGARASATRSVSSASGSSLTVTWTAPPNAGPPITDYDYRYRVESSQEWTQVADTPITELRTTITGLEANTKYEVQVRATNADGTGDWFALRSDPASSPASSPAPTRRGGGGAPACTQDDVHADTAAQATDSALSAVTAGAICPAADVDYFTVTAPGQGLVFVDTTGGVQTRGSIWQNDVALASGSTGGQQNERLGARVQAGPVVVAIQGQGGATGTYAIEITFVQGYLENPGADSFQSGVGILSGWVCEAEVVEIELNGMPQEAAYGTARLDTEAVCGDTDNGFGLLFNWNLLSDGEHEVVALVDGVELDRATVTVTTLGAEFLRDVTGTCTAADFPTMDETVTLVWQQTQQSFVIVDGPAPTGTTNRMGTPGEGYLENPGPNSFQSGIGVLSGWVCDADTVELAIGTAGRQVAAYGTQRLDTQGACGDTANGFGLLFNWNLLGEGEHEVVAFVDGEELGRATVRVTTLGAEFVLDAEGECVVEDFPMLGETVTLEWQQNKQNFVITDVE